MLKIGFMLGDDIGLEVVPETVKVMSAAAVEAGLEIEWREFPLGKRGHELHGHTMPEVTVEALAGDRWLHHRPDRPQRLSAQRPDLDHAAASARGSTCTRT